MEAIHIYTELHGNHTHWDVRWICPSLSLYSLAFNKSCKATHWQSYLWRNTVKILKENRKPVICLEQYKKKLARNNACTAHVIPLMLSGTELRKIYLKIRFAQIVRLKWSVTIPMYGSICHPQINATTGHPWIYGFEENIVGKAMVQATKTNQFLRNAFL